MKKKTRNLIVAITPIVIVVSFFIGMGIAEHIILDDNREEFYRKGFGDCHNIWGNFTIEWEVNKEDPKNVRVDVVDIQPNTKGCTPEMKEYLNCTDTSQPTIVSITYNR